MKKKAILVALSMTVIFFSFQSMQQGKGYDEIHYKAIDPVETDEYKISFSDMHSQEGFCLIRTEFTNKTKDFMFLDLTKVKFTVNGTTVSAEEKSISFSSDKREMIKAGETAKITIKCPSVPGLPAENVSVKIDGISRLPISGEVSSLEDYPFPDTKKEIRNGDLKIELSKLKKETRITDAKWKVENIGSSPILYDPSAITVTCDGNDDVWPTDEKNQAYEILWPGDKLNIKASFSVPGRVVDMQFANMNVHWNKTFLRSKEAPVEGCSIALEMDLGKTEGMN